MSAMSSQITIISTVCSAICSGEHQIKHHYFLNNRNYQNINVLIYYMVSTIFVITDIFHGLLWYCVDINCIYHYSDVIMGTIASQITSLTIVYPTIYSDADKKQNIKALRHWHLYGNSPGTGESPAQMASNAENVSIWWRYHGIQ